MGKHVVSTAVATKASEPGALDGHAAACSCGFVARTSLSAREASKLAREHAEWSVRNGR